MNLQWRRKCPEFAKDMHELTVIENIMEISLQVARENKLSRITVINLDVGKMQHLNESIMQHGFDAAKQGTTAGEASLKLNWLPVKLKCNECHHIFTSADMKLSCPYCGSKDTNIVQGTELNIKSIEGE